LSGISFALHEREVLGLAGLVGTGRSELVSSIVHYKFKPTNGDIRINGGKINIHNPSDARKHGIAMLSEDRRVNGFVRIMDIKKNVTLADLKQISSHFVIQDKLEQKKAEIFKKKLEIKASSIDMIVGNLSGGNQQKVVLAKWLMTKPKILILDEPTRGIDVGAKREIYNIIETLSASGLGIIIISSELPELYSICDRFIILREGHVINDIPKSQISENELFIKMAGI
jgi:D-xylose transport system ATP-binding protein